MTEGPFFGRVAYPRRRRHPPRLYHCPVRRGAGLTCSPAAVPAAMLSASPYLPPPSAPPSGGPARSRDGHVGSPPGERPQSRSEAANPRQHGSGGHSAGRYTSGAGRKWPSRPRRQRPWQRQRGWRGPHRSAAGGHDRRQAQSLCRLLMLHRDGAYHTRQTDPMVGVGRQQDLYIMPVLAPVRNHRSTDVDSLLFSQWLSGFAQHSGT